MFLMMILIVLIFIFGCTNEEPKYKIVKTGTETTEGSKYDDSENLSIIGETQIQGCDYFVVRTYCHDIPIHKGNCRNPIHHHSFDSTKYVEKIQLDSMKIDFLEKKVKILEKTENLQIYKNK